jgi:hypothetical protein
MNKKVGSNIIEDRTMSRLAEVDISLLKNRDRLDKVLGENNSVKAAHIRTFSNEKLI